MKARSDDQMGDRKQPIKERLMCQLDRRRRKKAELWDWPTLCSGLACCRVRVQKHLNVLKNSSMLLFRWRHEAIPCRL